MFEFSINAAQKNLTSACLSPSVNICTSTCDIVNSQPQLPSLDGVKIGGGLQASSQRLMMCSSIDSCEQPCPNYKVMITRRWLGHVFWRATRILYIRGVAREIGCLEKTSLPSNRSAVINVRAAPTPTPIEYCLRKLPITKTLLSDLSAPQDLESFSAHNWFLHLGHLSPDTTRRLPGCG